MICSLRIYRLNNRTRFQILYFLTSFARRKQEKISFTSQSYLFTCSQIKINNYDNPYRGDSKSEIVATSQAQSYVRNTVQQQQRVHYTQRIQYPWIEDRCRDVRPFADCSEQGLKQRDFTQLISTKISKSSYSRRLAVIFILIFFFSFKNQFLFVLHFQLM